MKRTIELTLACLFAASIVQAGEAFVVYCDTSGTPLARLNLSHPSTEITQEHFAAFSVQDRSPDGQVAGALPGSLALLEGPVGSERRKVSKEEPLVDLSGFRVRVENLAATSCNTILVGATGTVKKGLSLFFDVAPASALTSVLVSTKGNADLYIYDSFGTPLCSSTSGAKKIPDDCSVWGFNCQTFPTIVEVLGVKKKNNFIVAVWLTTAV